jgi:DNA-directed RNA polymerase I, II, and III subunit RPABC2
MSDSEEDIDIIDDLDVDDTAILDDEDDGGMNEEDGEEEDEAGEPEDEHPTYSKPSIEGEIVAPEDRITSDILSLYEMSTLAGLRAVSIAKHGNCFVDVDGLVDPEQMARREIARRRCPLVIQRQIAPGLFEYWSPNEMIHQEHWDD